MPGHGCKLQSLRRTVSACSPPCASARRGAARAIPVVITAKELSAAKWERLNAHANFVIQKGAYSGEDLLAEIRERVAGCMTALGAAGV